jgi:hypothetical protein
MTPHNDDARRWARTVLGMSAGDDPQFALLRLLRSTNFAPAPDVGAAFRVCAEADALGSEGVARALEAGGYGYLREQQGRHVIGQFADRFFEMPPVQRAAIHSTVADLCRADPSLQGRIHRLSRGLVIDLNRTGLAADEQRVVSIVRELFALASDERALRRRQLLRQAKKEQGFDDATLDRLATNWPELADIDPELWRSLRNAVATLPKPPAAMATQPKLSSAMAPIIISAVPRSPVAPKKTKAPAASPQPDKQQEWRGAGVLILLVGVLVSQLGRYLDSHRNEHPEVWNVKPAFDPQVVGGLKKPPVNGPAVNEKK